jgi:hypothetical protein
MYTYHERGINISNSEGSLSSLTDTIVGSLLAAVVTLELCMAS